MSISVPAAFVELLRDRLRGILEVTPAQAARLEEHYRLLMHWNRVLNLTSVRRLEDMVERHYCESLFLAARLPAGPGTLADIGSGGGFPGVPIAVVRSDWKVTLIESHQRKAVFLRESTRDLGNVTVRSSRVEAIEEYFDWGVSRAVRAEAVIREMERLSRTVGLLAVEEDCRSLAGWDWQVFRLPWGEHRSLCVGSR